MSRVLVRKAALWAAIIIVCVAVGLIGVKLGGTLRAVAAQVPPAPAHFDVRIVPLGSNGTIERFADCDAWVVCWRAGFQGGMSCLPFKQVENPLYTQASVACQDVAQ